MGFLPQEESGLNVSMCCCAHFKSDGDETWEPLGQKRQATFPCCQSQGSLDTYKGHQDRILERASRRDVPSDMD